MPRPSIVLLSHGLLLSRGSLHGRRQPPPLFATAPVNCTNQVHCHESSVPWTNMTSTDLKSHHIRCPTAVRWKRLVVVLHSVHQLVLPVRCGTPVKRGPLAVLLRHSALSTRLEPCAATSPRGLPLANRTFPSRISLKHHGLFSLKTLVCNCSCLQLGVPKLPPSVQKSTLCSRNCCAFGVLDFSA